MRLLQSWGASRIMMGAGGGEVPLRPREKICRARAFANEGPRRTPKRLVTVQKHGRGMQSRLRVTPFNYLRPPRG